MINDNLRNLISEITTPEGMSELIEAVRAQQKMVRTAKAHNVKTTLYVGATVDIDNRNKPGQVGEIKKINRTRAVVKIEGILYNCPFGMLSVKTDAAPKSGPVEELNGIF